MRALHAGCSREHRRIGEVIADQRLRLCEHVLATHSGQLVGAQRKTYEKNTLIRRLLLGKFTKEMYTLIRWLLLSSYLCFMLLQLTHLFAGCFFRPICALLCCCNLHTYSLVTSFVLFVPYYVVATYTLIRWLLLSSLCLSGRVGIQSSELTE